MNDYQDPSPVNPLPPVVILLVMVLVVAEPFLYLQKLGFLGGVQGIDGRGSLLQQNWLPAGLLGRMIELGYTTPEVLSRYIRFNFVNYSVTSTIFVAVFTLALGNFCARAFGAVRFVILFFASSILAAVAYGLLAMVFGFGGALSGGMIGAYGLIGGFTWLMWAGVVYHPVGAYSPFSLIGFLVMFHIVMSLLFGWRWFFAAQWIACATGFMLSFVLIPGGVQLLLQRIRRR